MLTCLLTALILCSNVFPQMEKYSKHLEDLVAERTRQLVHEQNKTAKVLHSKWVGHDKGALSLLCTHSLYVE